MRGFLKLLMLLCIIVGLLAMAGGLAGGLYFYIRLTRDLPRIERISDYQPKAVTTLHADDGTLIAELYDERRYPLALDKIPQMVRNAFLAAEDSNFYSHPGIDITSIIRAFWVNLRSKSTRQGASTITQQIVKSLLLSREKTYERKLKEAILSYRLEKALSKDEIFEIYLNEIFLGSGAYGVKAAARVHFHKELDELSIAEIAFLAGLPQKPTQLTNLKNRKEAIGRQHYVLKQMLDNKMISKEQYEQAMSDQLTIYPQGDQTVFAVPYYARHAISLLKDIFKEIDPNLTAVSPGGFRVETAVDIKASEKAQLSVAKGLREVDKRQGWRGSLGKIDSEEGKKLFAEDNGPIDRAGLASETLYKAVIRSISRKSGEAVIQVGALEGRVQLKKAQWAKKFVRNDKVYWGNPELELAPGDIIEVSLSEEIAAKAREDEKSVIEFILDQTPELEAAFVVSNALTGEVKVIIGGYDYKESKFNRATQAELQPGSSFKPFIYLASLESLKYTPTTIVPDSPISMMGGDGKLWSPQNYDRKYLGPITLRTALQRSRNVVSVYLLERMGVQRGIASARKLGISSPLAANMSIALGTSEVRLIEMVRAYGAFAAEGWLADSIVVKSISARDGKVIYRKKVRQEKVIEDEDAFIMANMMKGVVERGTAQIIKQLGRPVAGKTGTTNDQMDAWFIGYTPEWVGGTWVGYDVKKSIGRFETGGKAAAPIFLYFMQDFLADKPVLDFNIPDGVIPVPIDLASGHLASPDDTSAFIEYFRSGTEPRTTPAEVDARKDYMTSDEF